MVLYTVEQLTRDLQRFDRHRSFVKQGVRLVMCLALAADIVFVVVSFNAERLLKYLTNWTLVATCLLLALSFLLHSLQVS